MIATLLFIWLCIFGALLALLSRDRTRAGALTLSYFVALSLIHIPGALSHLGDTVGGDETLEGLELTILGMGAYLCGVFVAQLRANRTDRTTLHEADLDPEWLESIGRKFVAIGVFCFFFAIPLVGRIPSVTSVVSGFVGLVVIGIWLLFGAAMIRRDRRMQLLILGLLPILPFATLTFAGFVGFSAHWIITVLSFFFLMSRHKWWQIALMPALAYLSLSIFIAYVGERAAIRDLVWEEEADISSRVERIGQIFTNFELLDLDDPKHSGALDARLNQNVLVGAAMEGIKDGSSQYAHGSTVPLWIFIPRAVWPDKPDIGGGRTLVSDYTGITFSEGTSVGAGQVFEFYVNFGVPGVFFGFLIWGFMFMTMDRAIMAAMLHANMPSLLRHSMVGLALLAPGGNLIEILVAAVGAFVGTPLILYLDSKMKNLPLAVFNAKTKRRLAQR